MTVSGGTMPRNGPRDSVVSGLSGPSIQHQDGTETALGLKNMDNDTSLNSSVALRVESPRGRLRQRSRSATQAGNSTRGPIQAHSGLKTGLPNVDATLSLQLGAVEGLRTLSRWQPNSDRPSLRVTLPGLALSTNLFFPQNSSLLNFDFGNLPLAEILVAALLGSSTVVASAGSASASASLLPSGKSASPTLPTSITESSSDSIAARIEGLIRSDTSIQLVAGGAAGAASRTAVSPFERTKILFQIQSAAPMGYHHKGTWDTLKWIYKNEGIIGYFKGNGTNVVRMIPYSAVQFASYEYYKSTIRYLTGNEEMDTAKRLFAGALAGISSVTATYPLDLVRTRLSMEMSKLAVGTPTPGIWSVVKDVYKHEGGIQALYRGLVPTAGGVAPYVALNFASYELLRQYISSSDPTSSGPTNVQKLSAGALAGGLSQTITYPLDLLRRRMQVASLPSYPTPYRNTWHCVKSIAATEGYRGFYKGMVANYLKIVPANAVSFLTYELVKGMMGGTGAQGGKEM